MKLLLDQGLPRSTSALLRTRGLDALHVAEIGMSPASDAAILARGRTDERVIVTLDADFHLLLAMTNAVTPLRTWLYRAGIRISPDFEGRSTILVRRQVMQVVVTTDAEDAQRASAFIGVLFGICHANPNNHRRLPRR